MKQTIYSAFLKAAKEYNVGELEDYAGAFAQSQGSLSRLRQFAKGNSAVFVIAYPLNRYIYADENFARLIDVSQRDFDTHTASQLRTVLAPDNDLYQTRLFPEALNFYRSVPVTEYGQYQMRSTYRFLHRQRGVLNVMQNSYFIKSADDGTPLVSIGTITDISDVRNDNRMTGTIYRGQEIQWSNTYFAYGTEQEQALTSRESEILKLISDGFTTKEIAARLHRSVKTVDNHRQQIKRKTNCRNTAELVAYHLSL